jgi:hypothetical protein
MSKAGAIATRDTCTDCGKSIAESLADDALCTRCRYGAGTRKPTVEEESDYEKALAKVGRFDDVEAFDEPAAVVEADPGDGPTDVEQAIDFFEAIKAGLLIALGDCKNKRSVQGIKTRVGALLCIYGGFPSQEKAAEIIGVTKGTLSATVTRLRADLQGKHPKPKKVKKSQ